MNIHEIFKSDRHENKKQSISFWGWSAFASESRNFFSLFRRTLQSYVRLLSSQIRPSVCLFVCLSVCDVGGPTAPVLLADCVTTGYGLKMASTADYNLSDNHRYSMDRTSTST